MTRATTAALVAVLASGCAILGSDGPEGTWIGECDLDGDEYEIQLDVSVRGNVAAALETAVLPGGDGLRPTRRLDGTWIEPTLKLNDGGGGSYELVPSTDGQAMAGEARIGGATGRCELVRAPEPLPPDELPALLDIPVERGGDLDLFTPAHDDAPLELVYTDLAPADGRFGVYGEVLNRRDAWVCGAEILLDLYDDRGRLASPTVALLGEHRVTGGEASGSCIAPGDIGRFYWFDDADDILPRDVEEVEVDFEWRYAFDAEPLEARVELVSGSAEYSSDTCDVITLELENTGDERAWLDGGEDFYELPSAGRLLLFDADGVFVDHGVCISYVDLLDPGDIAEVLCLMDRCAGGDKYNDASTKMFPAWSDR
jgi:hypothetical protein